MLTSYQVVNTKVTELAQVIESSGNKVQIAFRVTEDLRRMFMGKVKSQGRDAVKVLSEFVAAYVEAGDEAICQVCGRKVINPCEHTHFEKKDGVPSGIPPGNVLVSVPEKHRNTIETFTKVLREGDAKLIDATEKAAAFHDALLDIVKHGGRDEAG